MKRAETTAAGVLAGVALTGAGAAGTTRLRRRRRRFRLRPGRPLGPELRRVLDGRLDVAIGRLAHRTARRERRIHDARTAVKRLRSTLRLVRDELGADAFRAENAGLRAAARRLSAARDAAVMGAALDELARRHPQQADEAELARLRERIAGAEAAAATSLDDEVAGALDLLRAGRRRLGPRLAAEIDPETLVRGLRRSYRRGRDAQRRARRDPSAENLHAWRKRVKDLRHQAELLREIDPDRFRRIRRRAGRLADVLGDDHDLAELRTLAADQPRMRALIDRRRRELRREAFRIGGKLYAKPPGRVGRRLRRRMRASRWGLSSGRTPA